MNKSLLLIILIILFLPITIFSQIKITGKIVNQKNKTLEFAEILLSNQDSIPVKIEFPDTRGEFIIAVNSGYYLLEVKQLDTLLWKQKINATNDLNLGTIIIAQKEQHLDEVVVTGKKKIFERKADRLIYNVENSISSAGGDAIDVLKVTPGIRVQNDQISMIGKSGMAVMVDDKIIPVFGESLISFLKSIPSDNIASIEVINTPPAKYDASGNSGIVNIKLKKAKENSWKNETRTSYIQTTYPAYRLGNNFSYNKNKINFVVDLDSKNGHQGFIEKQKYFYPLQNWDVKTVGKDNQDFITGRFALDYKITKNSNLGIQYLAGARKPDIQDTNTVDMYDLNNRLDSTSITKGYNKKRVKDLALNLYYFLKLDTLGRNISFNLDYFKYQSSQNRNFNINNYFPESTQALFVMSADNLSNQNIYNYSAKVDIEYPCKLASFSFGSKASFINNKSSVEYYDTSNGDMVFQPSKSNEFDYTENTQSAYIDAAKKIDTKWQIKLGLRAEITETKGYSKTLNSNNTDNYIKLFPTAYLEYDHSEDNIFSLSYGKRISRPAYWELNPFKWYLNQYSYAEGNPFLKPSYSHNVDFSYTYKNKWITNLSYSFTSNGFGQVPILNPSTYETIYTRLNYYSQNNLAFYETYTFNKYDFLNSQIQVGLIYANPNIDDQIILNSKRSSMEYYFSVNNSIIFNKNKTFLGEVNLWVDSSKKTLFYDTGSASSLDIALKYLLLDKKLQIALLINDVFKSSNPENITYTNNIKQVYNVYNDSRYVRLSLKYSFGNKKLSIIKREVGNEDEKGRAGN